MPGRGTEPGPALYPECTQVGLAGHHRHRQEGTRTCAGCREQMRVYMARYRVQRIICGPRMVLAVGTQRRVHALAVRGWGQREIAAKLGIPFIRFTKVMGQVETRRELADAVRELYADLAWRPEQGPNRLVRQRAAKAGWPGPMDWEDIEDPREVPECWAVDTALARAIEEAHAEALAMNRAHRKNEMRRLVRRTGRVRPAPVEMMMA